MSQICNFLSQIYMTFQDLKTYNFMPEGTSERLKEAVVASAVMPEVDRVTDYSDNSKHNSPSFMCEYLQRKN